MVRLCLSVLCLSVLCLQLTRLLLAPLLLLRRRRLTPTSTRHYFDLMSDFVANSKFEDMVSYPDGGTSTKPASTVAYHVDHAKLDSTKMIRQSMSPIQRVSQMSLKVSNSSMLSSSPRGGDGRADSGSKAKQAAITVADDDSPLSCGDVTVEV